MAPPSGSGCLVLLLDVFVGWQQADVGEVELSRLGIYLLAVGVVHEGTVLDVDIAHVVQSEDASGLDGGTCTVAHHAVDMDVLEVGRHLLLCVGKGGHGVEVATSRTVYVIALEDDGLVLDVVHHDVADEQLLGLATTTQSALEAQTCVGAAETTVAHHDTSHALHGLAAQHEATMGVEDGVVLNQDVLATVGGSLGLVAAALHAETVVASIDGAVDDESDVDVREVNGIAVLGVPRAAHGDAVHDDVLREAGVQVELRSVLDGDALYEHVLATLEAYQVVAQLLLFFGAVGNVRVAA